jgi:hypothetical protein
MHGPHKGLSGVLVVLLGIFVPAYCLAETPLLDNGPQFRSTAQDSQGRLHTLWVSQHGASSSLSYEVKELSGRSVIGSVVLAESAGRIRRPQLAIDELNVVHLLWQDRANGPEQSRASAQSGVTSIRYAKLEVAPDGHVTILLHPVTLNTNRAATHPSLAVDRAGWAYAVWEIEGNAVRLTAIDPSGRVGQVRRITRQATHTDHALPAVAVDRRGNVHVVWSAETGEKTQIVYKAFRGHGGQVLVKEKIVYASHGAFAQTKVVTFNNKGEIKIAWASQKGRSLRVATNAGSGYILLKAGRMLAIGPEVVMVVDQSMTSEPGRVWNATNSAVISQKPGLVGPVLSVRRVVTIDPQRLRQRSSTDQVVHKLLMSQLLRYASWSAAPPAHGVLSTVPPCPPVRLILINSFVSSASSAPTAFDPASEQSCIRSLNVSTQGGDTVRIISDFIV